MLTVWFQVFARRRGILFGSFMPCKMPKKQKVCSLKGIPLVPVQEKAWRNFTFSSHLTIPAGRGKSQANLGVILYLSMSTAERLKCQSLLTVRYFASNIVHCMLLHSKTMKVQNVGLILLKMLTYIFLYKFCITHFLHRIWALAKN